LDLSEVTFEPKGDAMEVHFPPPNFKVPRNPSQDKAYIAMAEKGESVKSSANRAEMEKFRNDVAKKLRPEPFQTGTDLAGRRGRGGGGGG
jgi:hypothetical protein